MEPIEAVLVRFMQIAAIPRPSRGEERISSWLQAWARERGLAYDTDPAGNLAIRVPATTGREGQPAIVLQGHMDMVCEKTPESVHDFLRDPIVCIREGEWLRADRTTLGADNGIAIALCMALVDDPGLTHPPLELLFTVEEEIGIGGAGHLDPGLITGKTLINLDSEDEGVLIVGCAGGSTTQLHMPVAYERPAGEFVRFQLQVGGLQGGHSGVDIHKQRGNANKILASALEHLASTILIQIASLSGGTAHNAIPRQAVAEFICPAAARERCHQQAALFEKTVQGEYQHTEPGLRLHLKPGGDGQPQQVLSQEQTRRIIQLLLSLPDGVVEMSASMAGFVETSSNLAVIELLDEELRIKTSQRSTVMDRLEEVTRQIDASAKLAGAETELLSSYPAWQPDPSSALLQRARQAYQRLFGQEPAVRLIHAGLECGILGDRIGDMDMLSIGPTIKNAHSPNETLFLPSLAKVWQLLVELLREER